MTKLEILIREREALIERSRLHREAIVVELERLHGPINLADKAWAFVSFIRNNPLVMVSVMSLFSKKFRKLSSVLTGSHAIFNLFRKSKKSKQTVS